MVNAENDKKLLSDGNLERSHLYRYARDMNEFAKPLFGELNTSVFSFVRMYDDNESCISLSTCPECPAEAHQEGITTSYKKLSSVIEKQKKGSRLNDHFFYIVKEENKKAYELGKRYGFGGILAMVDRSDGYFDLYVHSSERKNSSIGKLINNWEELVKYKNAFLDKFDSVIRSCESDRIRLNLKRKNDECIHTIAAGENDCPGRYYVRVAGNGRIAITGKEFLYLKLLGQGKTNAQIADAMDISINTVRYYSEKLKRKFAVYARGDLINIYLSSDISIL